MAPLTPGNIRARRIALWACSFVGALAISALSINSGLIGSAVQQHRWQRFQESFGRLIFESRNPIGIILLIMLFTGIMHAFRKELRIPAIILSIISLAALALAFNGGIRSDF